jgi:hypothetical protein
VSAWARCPCCFRCCCCCRCCCRRLCRRLCNCCCLRKKSKQPATESSWACRGVAPAARIAAAAVSTAFVATAAAVAARAAAGPTNPPACSAARIVRTTVCP